MEHSEDCPFNDYNPDNWQKTDQVKSCSKCGLKSFLWVQTLTERKVWICEKRTIIHAIQSWRSKEN